MDDRRGLSGERRVSRRGGRRATDYVPADADSLLVEWERRAQPSIQVEGAVGTENRPKTGKPRPPDKPRRSRATIAVAMTLAARALGWRSHGRRQSGRASRPHTERRPKESARAGSVGFASPELRHDDEGRGAACSRPAAQSHGAHRESCGCPVPRFRQRRNGTSRFAIDIRRDGCMAGCQTRSGRDAAGRHRGCGRTTRT